MKRFSQSGNSPASKFKLLAEQDISSSDEEFPETLNCFLSQPSNDSVTLSNSFPHNLAKLSSSPLSLHSDPDDGQLNPDFFSDSSSSSDDSQGSTFTRQVPVSKINADFAASLTEYIKTVGVSAVAQIILENTAIKEALVNSILSETHCSLKSSLKNSQITRNKKDRNYLLSITPRGICEELLENSSSAFNLIVRGLLGVTHPTDVFDSELLLNTITLLYSTVGKLINRKSTGYALLLTTAARDGGLREDTIKMLCCMVHPRTSQKYDKEVLGEGWDNALHETLKIENDHFEKQKQASSNIKLLLGKQ